MIDIEDLLNPPTSDVIFAGFISALVTMGVPADKWRTAGVARTILRVIANLYAGAAQMLAQAAGYAFLDTSVLGWLTRLALKVYGVPRRTATFATGQLVLTNIAGGTYNYANGEAFFQNPTTNKTYENASAVALGPGTPLSPTTQTIDISATEQGSASSSQPGQITVLVTQMLGVSVTNPGAVVGLDAESDEDLRTDCTNKLAARSVRGPRGAYLYYATHDEFDNPVLNADGAPVNINRVTPPDSSHTGTATVYMASPEGAPIAEDVTAAAASMDLNARPDGVTLVALAATEVPYNAQLIIWAKALPGLTADAIASPAAAAISTYLETYPIGGMTKGAARGLFGSKIEGVVTATNAAIFAVDGAVDLALVAGQVATDEVPTPIVRLVTS